MDTLSQELHQISIKSTEKSRYVSPEFLGLLESVGPIATAIAPVTPEIGSLVWGSVSLLAEKDKYWLSKDIHKHLVDICKEFDRCKRLLESYPDSAALKREVEEFYQEVVKFLSFSIQSIQRPSVSSPPREYVKDQLNGIIARIERCLKSIQREANTLGHQRHPGQGQSDSQVQQDQDLPLSTLFDIPQNRKFSGRDDTLKAMNDQMLESSGQPLQGTSVLLFGLGGMGKSSITVKYIYNNYKQYEPYIFWIPCDTRQKLKAAVLVACQWLKIPLENSDADLAKAPGVWKYWLEHSDKQFIVVYDNVEEKSVLEEVWPKTYSGTIIVTSRRRDVAADLVMHEHEITAMPPLGSRHLLLDLLHPSLQEQAEKDLTVVDKICEFLDGLPLAILLTSSMIDACKSLSGILQRLEKSRKTLLEWSDKKKKNTPLSLMLVWEANIKNLSPDSLQLLHVMGLLDPDNFTEDMVSPEIVASQSLPLPADETSYLYALAGLSEYSLVRGDRSSICMHRLLQDVIIERMSPETLRESFNTAVQISLAVFPKQSDEGLLMSSFWLQCQKYRSHVESLELRYKQQRDRLDMHSVHFPELAYRCSWSMYESGDYIRANDLAHTGLGILKHVKCETRRLQADLWTTIGGAQLLATNSKEAYDSLKEALDLRLGAVDDGLMEPDHPQIANSYMSLGAAAVGVGNLDEAIDLGEKSIEIRSGREEEQIQMLAMSHHNVALASLCARQLDKAEKFSKRSIELSRTRSPSMTKEQRLAMDARNVYGLANIYLAQGKFLEGRTKHEEALLIRQDVFKEKHPYTACSYWKLGCLWQAEDWQKAVNYYEKSIEIYNSLSLVQAPLGRSLHHLGKLLLQHDPDKADVHIRRAGEIYTDLGGEDFDAEEEEPFKKYVHAFYS